MAVVRSHQEFATNIWPLDGPAFGRRLAELLAAYEPSVVAAQLNLLGSHDTPRMRTILGDDLAGVRLATLIQMTLPGTPCLYYGDEVGLAGGKDPDCRGAFPWDGTAGTTDFGRSSGDSSGAGRSESDAAGPRASRWSPPTAELSPTSGGSGGAATVVAVNASVSRARLDLHLDGAANGTRLAADWRCRWVGTIGDGMVVVDGGVLVVALGPRSGSVLRVG